MNEQIYLQISPQDLQTLRYNGRTGRLRTGELERVVGHVLLPKILATLHHVSGEALVRTLNRALVSKVRISSWRHNQRIPSANLLKIRYRLNVRSKVVYEHHFVFAPDKTGVSGQLTHVMYRKEVR